MATYALYTASFGSSYANTPVKIFDSVTQTPAIVMGSASGGVVNQLGIATLDGSGNLSVYLDNSRTWQVDTYPIPGSTASTSNTQESTQLLVKAAVQTIAVNTAGGGSSGGATSALQTAGNASLATIAAAPVVATAVVKSASTAAAATDPALVVAISPNNTVPVSVTGGSTSALQTTGNTSLSTIATSPVVSTAVVKPASTAAVSTDPALVVAISPNSPVAVTGSVSTTPPSDAYVAATSITAQNLNPTTGTPTANSVVSLALSGQNVAVMYISSNTLGATSSIQVSYDGISWVNVFSISFPSTGATSSFSTIASGTTGPVMLGCAGAKGVRLAANSATVTGSLTVSINASTASTPFTSNVVLYNYGGNIATLGGAGGGTAAAAAVSLTAGATTTDYSAQSWVATSGSGATITDAGGAVVSYDINLTAFTAGASVGLDIFLQWSPDAGTTWYDLWQCEALTAVGHVYIPPLVIPGARRRLRWVNRGGAATTATVTAIANRLSVAPSTPVRQWFDRTAAVLAGTASAATSWYDVSGCRNISAYIPLGASTGPAQYQLQLSADGVNPLPASPAAAATSGTTTAYVATQGLAARFARLAVTTAATAQTAATAPVVITGC